MAAVADQFYMRLFSTSSSDIYPENTKTLFTVKLPEPLDFSGGSWECALVEIYHDRILGIKEDFVEKEVLVGVDELDNPDLHDVLKTQINSAYYTKEYFGNLNNKKYFDPGYQNSIWSRYNESFRASADFRSKAEEVTSLRNPIPFETDQKFFKKPPLTVPKDVKLEKTVPYASVNEVIHDLLYGYMDIFYRQKKKIQENKKKPQSVKESDIKRLSKSFEEFLYGQAHTYIEQFAEEAAKAPVESNSNFVLVYVDFIRGHVVGNTVAKVIFMGERKGGGVDNLFVTAPQYMPVEKSYISEISCLIANDLGQQLYLGESVPSKSTALTLHFRRAAI